MATGKIIRDYRPLLIYLAIIPDDERDRVLPSAELLERVNGMVKEGWKSLEELLETLEREYRPLINKEAAEEAIKEAWGGCACDPAEEIAKELSGWVLEMAEGLGLIKLRRL